MTSRTNTISLSNVKFAYDSKLVVDNLSLQIKASEVVALMGPSGCGKSTVLRLIAGLEIPDDGMITWGVLSGETEDTNLRFLFQDYDAYPWYTVWENVKTGSGPAPFPADSNVQRILQQVGLEKEHDRYPAELSGGMQKRLALARCMVRQPAVLLLDEPFASLDVDARYNLYALVQDLWLSTECSVIIVTHDIHEAILLADRIIVSTPRPFKIIEVLDVLFERPRGEEITSTIDYFRQREYLTSLLRAV